MKRLIVICLCALAAIACKTPYLSTNMVYSTQQSESVQEVNFEQVENLLAEYESRELSSMSRTGRDCSRDGKSAGKTTLEVDTFSTFLVFTHYNNKGYWHNPKGDFARRFETRDGVPFLWISYDNQTATDVVDGKTRYPSNVRYDQTRQKVRTVHKRNTWETDIPGKGQDPVIPCVIITDALTGDVICTGSYDCDLYISGCRYTDWQ